MVGGTRSVSWSSPPLVYDVSHSARPNQETGYSGSDLTHLARQASYGPLRSHGEAVLHMTPDEIRPVDMSDFVACLKTVRPSVNRDSLKQFEEWAKQFGERIG